MVESKDLTKRSGDIFLIEKMFLPKNKYFLHQQFSMPNSCIRILLFFWHTLYFPLHMPIICIIIYFGRIIIDTIVLWKENKMCIIFGRKINDIVA